MTALNERKPHIKIVLLGETGTGTKTSLLGRYIDGVCPENPAPTVGAASRTKETDVGGVPVTLDLWGLLFSIHTYTHVLVH